jgi:probable F420-dependent oxidoreductase
MKIGLMMPIAGDPESGWRSLDELRELAVLAEAGRLDSVWVADHLLHRFPGEPDSGPYEAWTTLTALAASTARVQVGTLVLAMPFRNPALLAKMAATLQEVSGGRLILGIGAGWHEPEFRAFNLPFEHRASHFADGLEILVPLLRGESVTFEGRYERAHDAVLLPSPPSRIPLLIAGRRPRMMTLIARHADAFNAAWLGPVSDLEPRIAPLREACEQVGRDFASIEITAGVNVIFPSLLDPGDELPRTYLSGSDEEIAAGLRSYADAGVGHVIVWLYPSTAAAVELLSRAAALAGA